MKQTSNFEAMVDGDRKYTDQEFALILRKASQIQEGSGGGGAEAGMSLDEIRVIAQEVGIDPAAVDRAAALVPHDRSSGSFVRLMGGPTKYRLESTMPGAVGPEDLTLIVDAVRRAAEHHGKAEFGPAGLEWSTVGEVSQVHVTAAPLRDGLHIRVTADRGAAAVLTFFFSFLGWMVVAGITGAAVDPDSAAVGGAILSGGVLGGLAQGRILWVRTSKALRDKLQRIMKAVTGAAQSP